MANTGKTWRMKTRNKEGGPARALAASQVKLEKSENITQGDIPRSDARRDSAHAPPIA